MRDFVIGDSAVAVSTVNVFFRTLRFLASGAQIIIVFLKVSH